jgi:hypothetical protein
LISHYEAEFFDKRQFAIEFDEKMIVKFSGSDLMGTKALLAGKVNPKDIKAASQKKQ